MFPIELLSSGLPSELPAGAIFRIDGFASPFLIGRNENANSIVPLEGEYKFRATSTNMEKIVLHYLNTRIEVDESSKIDTGMYSEICGSIMLHQGKSFIYTMNKNGFHESINLLSLGDYPSVDLDASGIAFRQWRIVVDKNPHETVELYIRS